MEAPEAQTLQSGGALKAEHSSLLEYLCADDQETSEYLWRQDEEILIR